MPLHFGGVSVGLPHVKAGKIKARLAALGTEESQPTTPPELAQWLRKETARWADIVQKTGVRAE